MNIYSNMIIIRILRMKSYQRLSPVFQQSCQGALHVSVMVLVLAVSLLTIPNFLKLLPVLCRVYNLCLQQHVGSEIVISERHFCKIDLQVEKIDFCVITAILQDGIIIHLSHLNVKIDDKTTSHFVISSDNSHQSTTLRDIFITLYSMLSNKI